MASGNDYAQWDDGWTKNPPQPPPRPSAWEWSRMSEAQRHAYDAAVTGYLMASAGADRWCYWNELRARYLIAWSLHQTGDMAVRPEVNP